jgi:hypothetical protein
LPGLQDEFKVGWHLLAPAFQSFDLWGLVERLLNLHTPEESRISLFPQPKSASSDIHSVRCFFAGTI